ncbi:MAG: ABC transporter substrate-binding protein [Leucobacter sp.]|nr:ABC transporter substrate-binding protein [Leucobacter sp.]
MSDKQELTEAIEPAETEKARFQWRSKRGLLILIGCIVLVAIAAVWAIGLVRANATPPADPVAVSVPLPIKQGDVPAGTKIGIIVTTGSGSAVGSEWAAAAEGAVVARERLALGGTETELVVENDRGTPAGAEEAVTSLTEQGVAGIIYASTGPQVASGLGIASEHGLPVILPFGQAPADSKQVWSMAPTNEAMAEKLTETLGSYDRPLFVNAGAGLPEGVTIADSVTFQSGTGAEALAMEVAQLTGSDPLSHGGYSGGTGDEEATETPEPPKQPADVIVLSGSPVIQATIVQQLQSRNVTVPILLTGSAASPGFADALVANEAAISPSLRTFGFDTDDAVALSKDGRGRSMSAFLASLRQISANTKISNLANDTPFAEVSSGADSRAHDAMLAFSRAVADAGSTDPAKVGEALGDLSLVAGDAITAAELDFTSKQVVSGPVVELYATAQQLGLRPALGAEADALVWFAEDQSQ